MCHNLWIIKIGNLQAKILLQDMPVKGKIAGIQACDCHFGITVTSLRAVMRLRPWNSMDTSSRACWGPLHAWNYQNWTAIRYFMAVKAKWCTNDARTSTPFFQYQQRSSMMPTNAHPGTVRHKISLLWPLKTQRRSLRGIMCTWNEVNRAAAAGELVYNTKVQNEHQEVFLYRRSPNIASIYVHLRRLRHEFRVCLLINTHRISLWRIVCTWNGVKRTRGAKTVVCYMKRAKSVPKRYLRTKGLTPHEILVCKISHTNFAGAADSDLSHVSS